MDVGEIVMEEFDREKRISDLAKKVLSQTRCTLLVNLRFLDLALSVLKPYETDEITLGTDGRYFLYNPQYFLWRYKNENNAVVRDYLHLTLHCVFRHMYVHTLIDRYCWDLACDMAVEHVICSMELHAVETETETREKEVFARLQKEGVVFTAEKLYRYFFDQALSQEKLAELRGVFCSDDHTPWYMSEAEKSEEFGLPRPGTGESGSGEDDKDGGGGTVDFRQEGDQGREGGQNTDSAAGDTSSEQQGKNGAAAQRLSETAPSEENEGQWKKISEKVQMDLETFSRRRGDLSGDMLQNLKEVTREKYDYTAFLKKFAVLGETMKLNDDEFDYIYYTYGLKLYQNIPLIEPLESKEEKRIREFVIALDTSGSTSGELVQKFVQKTFNILKSEETWFSRVNIHIIQCDSDIQEDIKITSQEEFDAYLKTMKIHGLGGTDFRPVFRYVEELRAQKEFTNLKGLIYFTDGLGVFPPKQPDYETAFVFVKEDYNEPVVPPWAIRILLLPEEI